jgi:hypothetical protein
MCHASDGQIGHRDVNLIDDKVLSLVLASVSANNAYQNRGEHLAQLRDSITASRMSIFVLPPSPPPAPSSPLILAYVREWKHWFVCDSRDVPRDRQRVALLLIALSHLDVISEFNHNGQFFRSVVATDVTTTADGRLLSSMFSTYCLFVLMKNIGHFGYQDEFSACLHRELYVLSEANCYEFYQNVLSLLTGATITMNTCYNNQ